MLKEIGLFICGVVSIGLLVMDNSFGIVFLIPLIAYAFTEGLR
jgi:hypothetical protein